MFPSVFASRSGISEWEEEEGDNHQQLRVQMRSCESVMVCEEEDPTRTS